jgi:hypothetical protein
MSELDLDKDLSEKQQFTAIVVEELLRRLEPARSAPEPDPISRDARTGRTMAEVSPLRRVSGRIVSYEDVMGVVYAGGDERRLVVASDAIITDLVRWTAARHGVAIVTGHVESATEGEATCS